MKFLSTPLTKTTSSFLGTSYFNLTIIFFFLSLFCNFNSGRGDVHLFCFISKAVIFNPLSFFKTYRSLLNRCLFFCQKSRPRCLFKSNQNLASKNFFYFLIYILQELIKIQSFYHPSYSESFRKYTVKLCLISK